MLICAGGTGGHLFPAEALAHELKLRGYGVALAADERIQKYAGEFPADEVFTISSATFHSRNPLAILSTFVRLVSGFRQSRKILRQLNPACVIGFGGYPTVPPILAAARMNIPTVIHDANAVLGRANRFLSRFTDRVAMGFEDTKGATNTGAIVTGNPVRPVVLKEASKPYPLRSPGDPFKLLVFGGSQGARFFSEVMPKALSKISDPERSLIRLVQQARPEDLTQLEEQLEKLGVSAKIDTFFSDLAGRMSAAHLVISRAGASTVSELAVMGRPSVLVPYPFALDHDQAANAGKIAADGGAKIFDQSALSPETLADEIRVAIANPKKLATAAKNAKKTGTPDAVKNLADMIEQLVS